MDLAEKIRAARTMNGLTLDQLGAMIGRSKQYMYQLEAGNIRLSYQTAVLIANALGKKPDDIFYE